MDEKELKKLKNQLKEVGFEIYGIAHIDDIFWQVQAIIKENSEINRYVTFTRWIEMTYIDSILIRLRRLVDKSKGKISLWRLLNDLGKNNSLFTRDWFLSMHVGDVVDANQLFDNLAGTDRNHVTKKTINFKRNKLKTQVSKVENYAHKNVAHLLKCGNQDDLTFDEIRKTISSSFKIYNWCASLLNSPINSPVPLKREKEWFEVFYTPWLDINKPVPHYKHLNEIIGENSNSN